MHYQRRLVNYRAFRSRLRVPLATVELTFGADLELGPGDADILIQRRDGAVLWQKERLLNLVLQALPAGCRQVVWLDCDIIFEQQDWPERVGAALTRFPLLQPFRNVHHLPPGAGPDEAVAATSSLSGTSLAATSLLIRPSVAAAMAAGKHVDEVFGRLTSGGSGIPTPGLAWAARRDLLEQHGFYDGCIIGGGDTAMACAAFSAFGHVTRLHCMNEWQRARYMDWAGPFHRAVGGAVSFIDGDVFHLWHGAIDDRKTRQRHEGLQPFGFDPHEDIAIAATGCWQWATDKPQLHRYVRDYFAARKEDG